MSLRVRPCPLPDEALLQPYRQRGAYTDCFAVDLPGVVPQAQFVEMFYTTLVFKLERWILKWAVARPSTDAQARALAAGTAETFAAWSVEQRRPSQLLMCDYLGRTRSWLMTLPHEAGTRLYFGSAVVPRSEGKRTLGWPFDALLGFHQLYSVILLRSAAARLQRNR